ncbi:cytochrome-c peroxidase [Spirosoma gilvum]
MKVTSTLLITSVALLVMAFFFSAYRKAPLFNVPPHFPEPVYPFDTNPLTQAGIDLGRALFYEPLLSKDNTISCSSCHQQASGFTQPGHALSRGINELSTKRNAMPLANLAWSSRFGWDGRIHDLDSFPMVPIQNEAEMNESLPTILEKLRKKRGYPILFTKAFGSPDITSERLLKALSQFMLTMVSANSRYDRAVRHKGATFTPAERAGWILVERKCSGCHPEPLFTDYSFRNIGLSKTENGDQGQFGITLKSDDRYKFKVPTLRNVAVTAPYMHDGRFATLEEVVAHYSSRVEHDETLDTLLKKDRETGILGISLTPAEQADIVAFLRTLTDDSFLQDSRFAEPSLSTSASTKSVISTKATPKPLP